MHFTLDCLPRAPSDPLEMLFPLPPALPSQESFTSLLTAVEDVSQLRPVILTE